MEKWQNLGYLFWAYLLIWGLLAGYLFTLSRQVKRLREAVRDLQRSSGGGR